MVVFFYMKLRPKYDLNFIADLFDISLERCINERFAIKKCS